MISWRANGAGGAVAQSATLPCDRRAEGAALCALCEGLIEFARQSKQRQIP
ncbi:MAG: hypothetical protein K5787_13250 [Lentisphaeria bacterium]|nr:hypothetical protein [Lentisphaeria bacterium]